MSNLRSFVNQLVTYRGNVYLVSSVDDGGGLNMFLRPVGRTVDDRYTGWLAVDTSELVLMEAPKPVSRSLKRNDVVSYMGEIALVYADQTEAELVTIMRTKPFGLANVVPGALRRLEVK